MPLWIMKNLARCYGEYDGFVVRAETADQARGLAVEFIRKQGADYDDTSHRIEVSPCERLDVDGPPSVILSSFKDGGLDHPA